MYREQWRKGYNFNALSEEWSEKLNWGNIPFYHAVLFLIKVLIDFIKGKDIVLFMPANQLVNKSFYL
jgi:hypothetical protein